jgi:DNA-binding MarR family transcriptional regulator
LKQKFSTYSFLLDRTARRVKQFAQKRFRELGMNVTVDQWVLMKHLSEHEGMNQRELSEVLFKDTPTLTRIIDLLVQKEYVQRLSDPEDRRCFKVSLTDMGKAKVEEYQDQVGDIRMQAWEGLDEDDFEQFKKVLNTIYHNLK